jgi:hypothetical protein
MRKSTFYVFSISVLLLSALVVVFIARAQHQQITEDATTSNPPRLKASGNQLIVVDTGETLRLKGFVSNYFRRGKPSTTTIDSLLRTIDKVKEWGGNTIDFYYDPWKIYRDPSSLRENVAPLLDEVVDYAGSRGLYVILNLSGNVKDILSGRLDKILSGLAERYKDTPYVILGIWTEPYNITADQWALRSKEMVKIVREANSQTPIIISGIRSGRDFNFLLKNGLPDANIILAVHDYPFADIAHSDAHKPLHFIIDNPDLQELRKTIPVMYEEFGGFWGGDFSSPEDLAIIKKQLDKVDEYGLSVMGYVLDYEDLPGLGMLDVKGNITPRGELFKENYTDGKTTTTGTSQRGSLFSFRGTE